MYIKSHSKRPDTQPERIVSYLGDMLPVHIQFWSRVSVFSSFVEHWLTSFVFVLESARKIEVDVVESDFFLTGKSVCT